tara:strand:- start:2188 stop:2316 length:129 start_codon:yes stop_codon:yes gene_type:complete
MEVAAEGTAAARAAAVRSEEAVTAAAETVEEATEVGESEVGG